MVKKKVPTFGKLGRRQRQPDIGNVTIVERIQTLGTRCLQATGLLRINPCSKGAFRPLRPRT